MATATAVRCDPKTKSGTTSITASQSLTLVKNLFRAAFSSIAYIRNLFDEECFQDGVVGGTRYKKIVRANVDNREAGTFIDWLERGVFDALSRKYLASVLLEIHDTSGAETRALRTSDNFVTETQEAGSDDPSEAEIGHQPKKRLLEVFSFSISYTGVNSVPQLSISQGKSRKAALYQTRSKDAIKRETSEVLRLLVEQASSLAPLPPSRVVCLKLLYTPETPREYEPPMFRAVKGDDEGVCWFENTPLRLYPGRVQTPYHEMAIHIRTLSDAARVNKFEEKVDLLPKGEAEARPGQSKSDPGRDGRRPACQVNSGMKIETGQDLVARNHEASPDAEIQAAGHTGAHRTEEGVPESIAKATAVIERLSLSQGGPLRTTHSALATKEGIAGKQKDIIADTHTRTGRSPTNDQAPPASGNSMAVDVESSTHAHDKMRNKVPKENDKGGEERAISSAAAKGTNSLANCMHQNVTHGSPPRKNTGSKRKHPLVKPGISDDSENSSILTLRRHGRKASVTSKPIYQVAKKARRDIGGDIPESQIPEENRSMCV